MVVRPAGSSAVLSDLRSVQSWPSLPRREGLRSRAQGGVWADREPSAIKQGRSSFKFTFFATCNPGLEQVVAEELRTLGVLDVAPGKAGVTFRSNSVADGYRALLWLRAAIRVLLLLGEGHLDKRQDGYQSLYSLVRNCGVQWPDVIPKGYSFSIEPRLWSCTNITSSRLVWQRVKDAVCDAVMDARRERLQPPQGGMLADVPLYVAAHQDHVTLYRDMSGQSLHRRGYRQGSMHRSPLNEAAAAGALMLAGWHKRCKEGAPVMLADPMCGSGTLLIEAGLMAHNLAPGLARATAASEPPPSSSPRGRKGSPGAAAGGAVAVPFPCVNWPDADVQAWSKVVQEARDLFRPRWNGTLFGNDVHEGALSLAMRDVRAARLTHCVRLHRGDCATWQLPTVPELVVTNPPWGMRLMGVEAPGAAAPRMPVPADMPADLNNPGELQASWRALSDFLRAQCPDTDALVLSGNKDNFNALRMRPSSRHTLTVGGIEVRALQYHVLPPKPATADTAAAAPR